MKIHISLSGVRAGTMDLDKKMPEVSKIYPDAKISKRAEPIECIKATGINKDIKFVKIFDQKVDIDINMDLYATSLMSFTYLDIHFEIDIKLYELFPDNNSLIVLLADLYRTNKQYNKAVELYSSLINEKRINKDQLWRYYYLRGISYERSNKWKKAENDFLQSLKIEPEQPQVLNYLAYGWIERNIFIDRSLVMLEKAVQKNPDSHYILDSLAWAYFKNNDLAKAAELMEEVIKIAPGEAISLDHLGDIYFALGRKREAYFMWNQAKDLAEPKDGISDSIQLKLQRYNAG